MSAPEPTTDAKAVEEFDRHIEAQEFTDRKAEGQDFIDRQLAAAQWETLARERARRQ